MGYFLRKLSGWTLPALLLSFALPVRATEPLGLSVRQEITASRMFGEKSPLRYAYAFHFDTKEPFNDIDSLNRTSWASDNLRFNTSFAVSPYYAEVQGGFYLRPVGPVEIGGFFAGQMFSGSGNRMVADSLRYYWNERSLGRHSWGTGSVDYLQIAAFSVHLSGIVGRTFLSARWITAALDVNTGEGTSAFHYGWDLPVRHGDNVMTWEAGVEHWIGEKPVAQAVSLGIKLSLSGASDETQFFFDPRPESEEVAQFRTFIWGSAPLTPRLRLLTGGLYSLHSMGGGENFLSDRIGLTLRFVWNWNHQGFSLPEM